MAEAVTDEDVPLFSLASLANGYHGIAKVNRDLEPVSPWEFQRVGSLYVRVEDYDRLRAVLDRINMAACYASEENTDARAETLLLIGQLARGEVMP